MTRTCTCCGLIKEMSEFPPDGRSYNGVSYVCYDCKANKTTSKESNARSRAKRLGVIEDLMTPCVKCGDGRKYLLDFHHKDPKLKVKEVKRLVKEGALDDAKREAEKCVCLCRNCHAEFHYLYGAQPENPLEALNEYLN